MTFDEHMEVLRVNMESLHANLAQLHEITAAAQRRNDTQIAQLTSLLAQDGLPPSESNPQFHQQMVYAVAMRTIRSFEQALGRLALWRSDRHGADGQTTGEQYVQRLRLYPHALREANAFYSPDKKAVLFGYF